MHAGCVFNFGSLFLSVFALNNGIFLRFSRLANVNEKKDRNLSTLAFQK